MGEDASETLARARPRALREPLSVQVRKEARRAERSARRSLEAHLAVAGLTASQYEFLAELRARPATSGVELAERLQMSPQTVWPMLNRLERQGFVRRGPGGYLANPATELTPAGEEIVRRAEDRLRAGEEALLGAMGHGDWLLLLDLLDGAAGALREATALLAPD